MGPLEHGGNSKAIDAAVAQRIERPVRDPPRSAFGPVRGSGKPKIEGVIIVFRIAVLRKIGKRVAGLLKERGDSIAVAESSTGGLITAALLSVPGASAYFLGVCPRRSWSESKSGNCLRKSSFARWDSVHIEIRLPL